MFRRKQPTARSAHKEGFGDRRRTREKMDWLPMLRRCFLCCRDPLKWFLGLHIQRQRCACGTFSFAADVVNQKHRKERRNGTPPPPKRFSKLDGSVTKRVLNEPDASKPQFFASAQAWSWSNRDLNADLGGGATSPPLTVHFFVPARTCRGSFSSHDLDSEIVNPRHPTPVSWRLEAENVRQYP